MAGKGHGGGYHRSTDDGAVVQSRQEEIPLQGSASNGTQTAKYPDTQKSPDTQKYSGSHYSYSSYY